MYANEDERKQDEQRLYDQLLNGSEEFCTNLHWLSEKALQSDAPDRFEQMWKVYLYVMTEIGGELFGGDVYWNTDSEMIEPVLDKLLKEGYDEIIQQLIFGIYNLLWEIKTPNYSYLRGELHDISTRFRNITYRYYNGGVLTIDDRMVKWDYIDHANRMFGYAYDIVEGEANATARSKAKASGSNQTAGEIYQSFMDDLEKQNNPVKYFFKKVIGSIKKLFPNKK